MEVTEMLSNERINKQTQPFSLTNIGGRVLLWIFLLVTALLIVFPVVVTFLGSFMSNMEITKGGKIFPSSWQIVNYKEAWVQANFARFTWNSLFLSGATTIGTLIVASMAAYVVGRIKFPGKPFSSRFRHLPCSYQLAPLLSGHNLSLWSNCT